MARRRFPALVGALLLCLSIVSLAAAQGQADLPAWGTEPTPNAGFPRNTLTAVDAVSPSDVWAVGNYEAAGFNHPRPLIERWNGSAWSSIAPTWDDEGELLGVAAVSSDDVWMVGGNQNGGPASTTLRSVSATPGGEVWAVGDSAADSVTLRWNGSAWVDVPAPNPGMSFLDLNGVSVISPNDAWAVGYYDVNGSWRTLTMHW